MGRLDKLPPYLFSAIDAAKEKARAAGVSVVDLGVGDPDRPTPQALVEVMARVLAATVERLGGADGSTEPAEVLILIGATTLDSGQGQLGPRLAEALGWPQIVSAWQVEVADGQVQAVQKHGAGYVAVEADLPAVVTVLPGALKPRYPDGVRLINPGAVGYPTGEKGTARYALLTWEGDWRVEFRIVHYDVEKTIARLLVAPRPYRLWMVETLRRASRIPLTTFE